MVRGLRYKLWHRGLIPLFFRINSSRPATSFKLNGTGMANLQNWKPAECRRLDLLDEHWIVGLFCISFAIHVILGNYLHVTYAHCFTFTQKIIKCVIRKKLIREMKLLTVWHSLDLLGGKASAQQWLAFIPHWPTIARYFLLSSSALSCDFMNRVGLAV